jgi:hypothetical protein
MVSLEFFIVKEKDMIHSNDIAPSPVDSDQTSLSASKAEPILHLNRLDSRNVAEQTQSRKNKFAAL